MNGRPEATSSHKGGAPKGQKDPIPWKWGCLTYPRPRVWGPGIAGLRGPVPFREDLDANGTKETERMGLERDRERNREGEQNENDE